MISFSLLILLWVAGGFETSFATGDTLTPGYRYLQSNISYHTTTISDSNELFEIYSKAEGYTTKVCHATFGSEGGILYINYSEFATYTDINVLKSEFSHCIRNRVANPGFLIRPTYNEHNGIFSYTILGDYTCREDTKGAGSVSCQPISKSNFVSDNKPVIPEDEIQAAADSAVSLGGNAASHSGGKLDSGFKNARSINDMGRSGDLIYIACHTSESCSNYAYNIRDIQDCDTVTIGGYKFMAATGKYGNDGSDVFFMESYSPVIQFRKSQALRKCFEDDESEPNEFGAALVSLARGVINSTIPVDHNSSICLRVYTGHTIYAGFDQVQISQSVWLRKDNPNQISAVFSNLCVSRPHCSIQLLSNNFLITAILNSRLGEYEVHYGDEIKTGRFVMSTMISQVYREGENNYITVKCNNEILKRRVIMTVKEFCDRRYPDRLEYHQWVWCMHKKAVTVFLILLSVACGIKMLSPIFGMLIGFLLGLSSVPFYKFWSQWVCMNCKCYKNPFRAHVCTCTTCVYCGKNLITNLRNRDIEKAYATDYASHLAGECNMYITGSVWYLVFLNTMSLTSRALGALSKVSVRTIGGVAALWILVMFIGHVDAVDNEVVVHSVETSLDYKSSLILQAQRCYYLTVSTSLAIISIVMVVLILLSIHKTETVESEKLLLLIDAEAQLPFSDEDAVYKPTTIPSSNTTNHIKSSSKSVRYSVAFLFIILFVASCCVGTSYCNMVDEEMEGFARTLHDEGFIPFDAVHFGSSRQAMGDLQHEENCNAGKCVSTFVMKGSFLAYTGSSMGYTFPASIPKGSQSVEMHFNLKVRQLGSRCEYSKVYETSRASVVAVSGDTCTEDCTKCLSKLKCLPDNNDECEEVSHSDTSSWSCDGPGCLSINSGCTCGKCRCIPTGKRISVKKLVREDPWMDLCMLVAGKGYCKSFTHTEKTKTVEVLSYRGPENICPQMLACDSTNICKTGPINQANSLAIGNFGSFQIHANNVLAYKKTPVYNEECWFARSRSFTFLRCCEDGFEHWDSLSSLGKVDWIGNRFVVESKTGSTWSLKLQLPELQYQMVTSKAKVSSVKIVSCHGCYSCAESGYCNLIIDSTGDMVCPFTTDLATDQTHITLSKGIRTYVVNVRSEAPTVEAMFTVCNVTGKGDVSLKDPPKVPHGSDKVVVDQRIVNGECTTFLCLNFNMPGVGWLRNVIYLVFIFVILTLVLYFLPKLYWFASVMFRSGMSKRKYERQKNW